MKNTKLKKCPFCGDENAAVSETTIDGVVTAFATCPACGAKGPACSMDKAAETAAKAWNGAFMRHIYY